MPERTYGHSEAYRPNIAAARPARPMRSPSGKTVADNCVMLCASRNRMTWDVWYLTRLSQTERVTDETC